jgi:hypothetical protein
VLSRNLAETIGFEPMDPVTQIDGLANRCLRPLSQVSINLTTGRIRTYKDYVYNVVPTLNPYNGHLGGLPRSTHGRYCILQYKNGKVKLFELAERDRIERLPISQYYGFQDRVRSQPQHTP